MEIEEYMRNMEICPVPGIADLYAGECNGSCWLVWKPENITKSMCELDKEQADAVLHGDVSPLVAFLSSDCILVSCGSLGTEELDAEKIDEFPYKDFTFLLGELPPEGLSVA